MRVLSRSDFSRGFHRAEKLGGVRRVAIAVDGHEMGTPGHGDVAALKSFIQANRGIRMRRYFYGAASFEAASAARRARFDYVQGAGVAPARPVAGQVFRVEWKGVGSGKGWSVSVDSGGRRHIKKT